MKNNNGKNNDTNNKIEAKETILMKYLNQNDDETETLIEDRTAT